jgi:hypothetical protein
MKVDFVPDHFRHATVRPDRRRCDPQRSPRMWVSHASSAWRIGFSNLARL